ncbi:hypothetical protein [Microcystis sp. M090S1]|jgi:hypothetical protein|uniref:hypothetical protein n=1 Tax=Microcystis sp. M090S1 TaxID=2771135 RepID=UPI00258992CB|nr:hypothetical protein [Microcystis sp. M090S1]
MLGKAWSVSHSSAYRYKLRRQLGDIKKYIINNYGDKKWQEITRYFADEQELKQ